MPSAIVNNLHNYFIISVEVVYSNAKRRVRFLSLAKKCKGVQKFASRAVVGVVEIQRV